MQEANTTTLDSPSTESKDVLTEILREGAQTLQVQAIEEEVADWIERHADLKDEYGHRLVVRNGRLPKRQITTGIGHVEIEQPRGHDRRLPADDVPDVIRGVKFIDGIREDKGAV